MKISLAVVDGCGVHVSGPKYNIDFKYVIGLY